MISDWGFRIASHVESEELRTIAPHSVIEPSTSQTDAPAAAAS